jgi:hypothetical protein
MINVIAKGKEEKEYFVLLNEKNEPVSLTTLIETTANDDEFQEEVDRLLEMAEVE